MLNRKFWFESRPVSAAFNKIIRTMVSRRSKYVTDLCMNYSYRSLLYRRKKANISAGKIPCISLIFREYPVGLNTIKRNTSFESDRLVKHLLITNVINNKQFQLLLQGYLINKKWPKTYPTQTDIDPLHKWRLDLNNNTWYILSLILMFQDKGFFAWMRG